MYTLVHEQNHDKNKTVIMIASPVYICTVMYMYIPVKL